MSNVPKNSKNENVINSEQKKISDAEFIYHDVSHGGKINHSTKSIQPKKILFDTEVKMIVELGRSKIKIKDFLRLSQGSMLILDKSVKEPLDIFINGHLIASGEIVVLDKKYGLRITKIHGSLKI